MLSYSLSVFGLGSLIGQALQNWRLPTAQPTRRRQQVSKGETIYSYGDRAAAVYYLESGRVKLTRYTTDGKLVTLRTVEAGELFGEADLYFDSYHCKAAADVESRIVVYPLSQVQQQVVEDSRLAQALLQQSHLLLQQLRERLLLLTIRLNKDRILEYLRHQPFIEQPDGSRTIELDGPLKAIAEELDISPEAFYRSLARLEDSGDIRRARPQITLL